MNRGECETGQCSDHWIFGGFAQGALWFLVRAAYTLVKGTALGAQ